VGLIITREYPCIHTILLQSQTLKHQQFGRNILCLKQFYVSKKIFRLTRFQKSKVVAFLKRNAVGYEPTKSKVLSREEINTFLSNAEDETYLLIKVGRDMTFKVSSLLFNFI
jgi:uncharacterized protein